MSSPLAIYFISTGDASLIGVRKGVPYNGLRPSYLSDWWDYRNWHKVYSYDQHMAGVYSAH
jgi:hypothetical protein